jgi:hypothetical protein
MPSTGIAVRLRNFKYTPVTQLHFWRFAYWANRPYAAGHLVFRGSHIASSFDLNVARTSGAEMPSGMWVAESDVDVTPANCATNRHETARNTKHDRLHAFQRFACGR